MSYRIPSAVKESEQFLVSQIQFTNDGFDILDYAELLRYQGIDPGRRKFSRGIRVLTNRASDHPPFDICAIYFLSDPPPLKGQNMQPTGGMNGAPRLFDMRDVEWLWENDTARKYGIHKNSSITEKRRGLNAISRSNSEIDDMLEKRRKNEQREVIQDGADRAATHIGIFKPVQVPRGKQ